VITLYLIVVLLLWLAYWYLSIYIEDFGTSYVTGMAMDYSNNVPGPDLKTNAEKAEHDDVLVDFHLLSQLP
jgi:hypothetical protein